MSGAIEKALRHLMSAAGWDENVQRIESEARAELAAKDATIERLTEVQRRDRACLFGIYKTNARLRAALEHAASYMVTLCMDRPVHEDGEVVGHWQTVDWLIGLRELAEESHSIALSSLPPSEMRLVPVERLREIAELVNGLGYAPDWLADAIRDAEGEKP